MFQQFENELNTLLTTGVRNISGAAQEIMNTAGTIQAQESKIKSLVKTKKSLKKKIVELEEKLKKSEHKVNKYRKKLELLAGKVKSTEGRAVEVVEDTQEELLVLSHNSEALSHLSDNSIISAEDIESEEGDSHNSTTPEEGEEAVISEVEDGSEKDFENVSLLEETSSSQTGTELDLVWGKMTDAIQETGRLREEMVELKRLHREQCLGLKTENSNLTIELEDYRLSSHNLNEEIKQLSREGQEQFYEIQNLTINRNFWRRNFYVQIFLIGVYLYLTQLTSIPSEE